MRYDLPPLVSDHGAGPGLARADITVNVNNDDGSCVLQLSKGSDGNGNYSPDGEKSGDSGRRGRRSQYGGEVAPAG